jgi:hypothetical protein
MHSNILECIYFWATVYILRSQDNIMHYSMFILRIFLHRNAKACSLITLYIMIIEEVFVTLQGSLRIGTDVAYICMQNQGRSTKSMQICRSFRNGSYDSG